MKEKLAKLFEGKGLTVKQRILVWGAITLVGVMIIFATYYLPESFSVEEGDISPATIEARQTVTYEDKAKTEANRKAAEDRVGDIYVFDTSRLDSQVSQIEQIFKVWDDMLLLPEEDRLSAAQVYISQLQLKEGTASAILSMDSITLQALKSEAVNIMSEQWLKGVREDEVETARKNILDEVYLRVNDEEQVAFTQAIFRFINLDASSHPALYAFFSVFNYNSVLYLIVYVLLIVAFNYFYVAIQYNPVDIANQLRKNNGTIPGIRPGKPTSDFITKTLSKITLIGAIFLAIVAGFPIILGNITGTSIQLGGTTLLIVVGVALETGRSLEGYMTARYHKGFLE